MCPSCSAVRPPFGWPEDSLLGQLVDGGRYQVEKRLGSGGFGVVYEVIHTLVGQSRAMKVMDQKLVGQGDIQRRFIDEWGILDKLDHPHIVRCYEIGILPETRQPFMLLDLLRGRSLFDVVWPGNVAKPRRMSPKRAAHAGIQIASALAHAHSNDLLHRDLKPDNVLLLVDENDNEEVKVIDFGIAKILGTASVDRMTSRVVGTPEYMAPEQFNPGKTLDGRLDLWQLGAVLFFIITGWPPYSVKDDEPLGVYREMLARTGHGPRPSEQYHLMHEYPALDTLVGDLLATEPKLRPDNAQVVVERLAAILEGELALAGDPLPTPISGVLPVARVPGGGQPEMMSTVQAGTPQMMPDSGELRAVSAESVAKLPQAHRRKAPEIKQKAARTRKSKLPNMARKASPTATRKAPSREAQARQTARVPTPERAEKTGSMTSRIIFGLIVAVATLAVALVVLAPWDKLAEPEMTRQPEFSRIPAGYFDMGSPPDEAGRFDNETMHNVTLTRSFFAQTTEVTQFQWRAIMGNNPSSDPSCGDNCPVDSVSWWDALEYLNRRSIGEGFEKCYVLEGCTGIPGKNYRCREALFEDASCNGYRLPTEAEWEYAARAGTTTPLSTGILVQMKCSPLDKALDKSGWYCGNAKGRAHPVAQKTPNAWGLYDTAGSVNEWVWDLNFGDYDAEAVSDPLGPDQGAGRTYRGGAWSSAPTDCRVAARGYTEAENRRAYLGFRAVRTAR